MAEVPEEQPEVTMVEEDDDDGNDWPDIRPQNVNEAQAYQDGINKIFDYFSDLLNKDHKRWFEH